METWLALLIPAGLALAAAVGWALSGRRPRPPAPPAVVAELESAHARTVERLEVDARAIVADAERVDALPPRERNAAIGARLRR